MWAQVLERANNFARLICLDMFTRTKKWHVPRSRTLWISMWATSHALYLISMCPSSIFEMLMMPTSLSNRSSRSEAGRSTKRTGSSTLCQGPRPLANRPTSTRARFSRGHSIVSDSSVNSTIGGHDYLVLSTTTSPPRSKR